MGFVKEFPAVGWRRIQPGGMSLFQSDEVFTRVQGVISSLE